MARIDGVDAKSGGPVLRMIYRFAAKQFGALPEPLTVAAHHRGLMTANLVHEGLVHRASTALPASVREVAVYRVAQRLGCSWCVDFGAMMQRLDGLDIERLAHIDDYADSPAYSDDERLAIAYADAMTETPTGVTDTQVAELRERFGEKGVLELTYQIALENLRARSNSALGITEQGFSSGDACRVPTP